MDLFFGIIGAILAMFVMVFVILFSLAIVFLLVVSIASYIIDYTYRNKS